MKDLTPSPSAKFADPDVTALGDQRAKVALSNPQTGIIGGIIP